MSRLPRLHTLPENHFPTPTLPSTSTAMITTRKRKAAPDDDGGENPAHHPRKLPAISENNQPLKPTRGAPNVVVTRAAARKASGLTIPQGPAFTSTTARRVQRATSAPPKSEPIRPPARPTPGARAVRPTAAGPSRLKGNNDQRFQSLQAQVTSIESARAADAARLAADMEAERTKLAELHANHMALSRELATAKSQELDQRRELLNASDELEALKRRHAHEMLDLESDAKRKEREVRELKEDLRLCQEDLDRERETTKTLKATVSHQSTAQLTLNTQVTALQAQLSALQSALDTSSSSGSQLRLELEAERKRVVELEQEVREAETLRRKLHNMVQELKVRVFHGRFSLRRILMWTSGKYPCLLPCATSSAIGNNFCWPSAIRDFRRLVEVS